MKKLLLLLFLSILSTQSLANVGDVYFCNEIEKVAITAEGIEHYELEKFKFKWNENSIKFSDEVWGGLAANITDSADGFFTATKEFILINFRFNHDGVLVSSYSIGDSPTNQGKVVSIANCTSF